MDKIWRFKTINKELTFKIPNKMKKILMTLTALALIISCKHSGHEGHNQSHQHKEGHQHENEDHDHDKDERHDHERKEKHHHEEGEIHLTPEQIKSAKIKIGKIEKHVVREHLDVTGSIQAPPQSRASIYAPLEAFVHQAKLLLGDKVKKGQTIAILQHPNFTKLQYSYLESINKLRVADQEFKRKEMLFKSDIASKKDYQLAESAYNSAKSLVQSYRTQLEMAGISPEKVKIKGIQQYVYVQSPISGYIVKSNLNQGKFLSANELMMEIIDNDHMHAELNVFTSDIDRIKTNDTFTFKTDGTVKTYEGYTKLISNGVDNQTKTINVHGHFKDPQHLLKVGTFINAKILLGEGKSVYAIPKEAITEFEGKKVIFKAESDVEFIATEVVLGNYDNGYYELKSIENSDYNINIIMRGAHLLKGELLKNSGEMSGHGHAH